MEICIVGNKKPSQDFTQEIDSADRVVRVSKMDYLDTGLIGSRTDELYLEPNMVWHSYSPEVRKLPLLSQIPLIHIRESWWNQVGEHLLKQKWINKDRVKIIPKSRELVMPGCTTLAIAVYDISLRFPEAKLLLTGADIGEERRKIFWIHVSGGEVEFLNRLISEGKLKVLE